MIVQRHRACEGRPWEAGHLELAAQMRRKLLRLAAHAATGRSDRGGASRRFRSGLFLLIGKTGQSKQIIGRAARPAFLAGIHQRTPYLVR